MSEYEVEGRYPHRPMQACVLRPENMRANVTADTQHLLIRIDDAGHDDMWIEVRLSREGVLKILAAKEGSNGSGHHSEESEE